MEHGRGADGQPYESLFLSGCSGGWVGRLIVLAPAQVSWAQTAPGLPTTDSNAVDLCPCEFRFLLAIVVRLGSNFTHQIQD